MKLTNNQLGVGAIVVIIIVLILLLPLLWHLMMLLIGLAAIAVLIIAGFLLWGYFKLRKFKKEMNFDDFANRGNRVEEEIIETNVVDDNENIT